MRYIILFFIFFTGCKINSTTRFKPFLFDYFPKEDVKSTTVHAKNGVEYLYINDEFQCILNFENLNLWENLFVKIPRSFSQEKAIQNEKYRTFRDGSKKLTIQLIQDNTDDAFDFFFEIYNHAFRNNYKFDLNSSMHFNSLEFDFVVYDVILEMDNELKYVLGCIIKKGSTLFYDISLISNSEMQNEDRYHFTEFINSLRENEEAIIPYSNEIIEKKLIEVPKVD